jgi:hypothetical protein
MLPQPRYIGKCRIALEWAIAAGFRRGIFYSPRLFVGRGR